MLQLQQAKTQLLHWFGVEEQKKQKKKKQKEARKLHLKMQAQQAQKEDIEFKKEGEHQADVERKERELELAELYAVGGPLLIAMGCIVVGGICLDHCIQGGEGLFGDMSLTEAVIATTVSFVSAAALAGVAYWNHSQSNNNEMTPQDDEIELSPATPKVGSKP